MRTFVAIDLEHDIKEKLSTFIQNLEKHNPKIRWVKNQGMHLTLKFIGEVDENRASEVRSVLMGLSLRHKPFPLKLVGTGSFPPKSRHPRILWVGIEKSLALISMQKDIEAMLEELSISREKRAFFPHMTLGRVKSNHNIEPVLEELAENRETIFGRMKVKEITYYKSTLKPTGAEYSSLAKIQLK